jgi:hypothetical protein
MKKQRKSILVLAVMVAFVATGLFLPGLVEAGDLEPSAAPGPTMKTLDQIPPTWSQILPAVERFELVMGDVAVLDKETGLVWALNANIAGVTKTWLDAMNYCLNLSIGDRKGWRLPTVEELASLVDPTHASPALPAGHPFTGVEADIYWSSTTYAGDSTFAWVVDMLRGLLGSTGKTSHYYVWPVRGGGGY